MAENQASLELNSSEPSEIHCVSCGRYFGNSAIFIGMVELKCPKCKKWTTISNWPDELDNGVKIQYADKVKVT